MTDRQQYHSISLLLPWYITGKLSDKETTKVEEALELFPELQRELEQERYMAQLIREDHEVLDLAAITTEEQRLEGLLERIKQDTALKKSFSFSLSRMFASLKEKLAATGLASFLPVNSRTQTAGWAKAAFASVIIAQVAILFMVYNNTSVSTSTSKESDHKYELVSENVYQPSGKTVLMLQFTPQATNEQINDLLNKIGAEKIDHPDGTRHYQVELSSSLQEQELDRLIGELEKKRDLIQLVGKGL